MIMSKTNSESREVRESCELTNDELALVAGGRTAAEEFKLAREDFRDLDFASGMAHMAAGYNALGWL
jgi:hypothetical protein